MVRLDSARGPGQGRAVSVSMADYAAVDHGYATTIHKSQGSEFPAVVIPLATQHYLLLQRNLLYTGITRGKKLVVVTGQTKALALAAKKIMSW